MPSGNYRKFGDKPWVEYFWSNVDVRGKNECWPWTGPMDSKGYGYVGRRPNGMKKTRGVAASRWMLCRKSRVPLDHPFLVLHRCDNPICVNPSHLEFGTTQENMRQALERGRILRGEGQPNSKLKQHQVDAIFKDTRSARTIAAEYGVSRPLIAAIRTRRAWGWMFTEEEAKEQRRIRDKIRSDRKKQKDEARERRRAEVRARREENGTKLTIHQVREILRDNRSLSMIAQEYGICIATVSRIQRGLVWKHAGLPPNRAKGVPAQAKKKSGRPKLYG